VSMEKSDFEYITKGFQILATVYEEK